MKWDDVIRNTGDAAEKRLRSMARDWSDEMLKQQYYNNDNSWKVQEILENEMRRRGLL